LEQGKTALKTITGPNLLQKLGHVHEEWRCISLAIQCVNCKDNL